MWPIQTVGGISMLSKSLKQKLLASPFLLWVFIFTIVPIILMVNYGFTHSDGSFTLDNLTRFFSPLYLGVMRQSFELAILATVICFFISYPVAYILASKAYQSKSVLIALFVVPMWMNFLVRTYAWTFILGNQGLLNNLRVLVGLERRQMMFTDGAVLLGLVYTFLPFMIFPIYSSLQKIDPQIVEGARDLGANTYHVFRRIIFPLSLPGVASGVTMVFMPAVATFLVSNLLGGAQYILIGNLIEIQFLNVGNRHFGSMLALILFVLIIACNLLLSRLQKEEEGS